MRPGDVKRAFLLAWQILMLPVLLILLAPFTVPHHLLVRLVPVCEAKRLRNQPCLFCGMTTSFLAIARADWDAAAEANRGGPPLFAALTLNECLGVWVLFRSRRPKR